MSEDVGERRPIKSRDAGWARATARFLSRTAVTPNMISVLSVGFAAAAGACFYSSGHTAGVARVVVLMGAAVGVQMRLICNLLDGMLAVEGGKASKTGGIFNDLPDRFADLLILVPAGYGIAGAWPFAVELGWLAGTLAVLTAYVRMLGASLGLSQDFSGIMSKPKRMAVMTVATLLSMLEPLLPRISVNDPAVPQPFVPLALVRPYGAVLLLALTIVATGSAITTAGRTVRMARKLKAL